VTSGPSLPSNVVERSFYEGGSVEVAPLVLNKLLARLDSRGRVLIAGRVVEVEAYRGSEDPASHAFKGPTRRNAVMFGPPGHLYVYFTYGMHWCANLVCSPEGTAQAVLLRALSPVSGSDVMRAARGEKVSDRNLLSGPARLCQAFSIKGGYDGADLVTGDMGLVLLDDGVAVPEHPAKSPRVGITQAADVEWRFFVPGDPNVSKGRPTPSRAPTSGTSGETRPL
jgi:DNA-3-methyladenine glycosylase